MLRFLVRRLLLLVPILLGVSILIFAWIRALPGSPAEALLGERATPEAVAQIKHQYGLDRPVYEQASIEVMKFLPMVPYVHSKPALGFQKTVKGYIPSPVSLEPFSIVSIGT